MRPYTITLIKIDGFWRKIFGWMFNRKFKEVKGHFFPKDLPPYVMMITLLDEKRFLLDFRHYKMLELSKEFYLNIASNVQSQSGGTARLIETDKKENIG